MITMIKKIWKYLTGKNNNTNTNNNSNTTNFVNNGTDLVKLIYEQSNLEIEQNNKVSIIRECDICCKSMANELAEIEIKINECVNNTNQDWTSRSLIIRNYSNLIEKYKMEKSLIIQGLNIDYCDNHKYLKNEFIKLYYNLKNFKENKELLIKNNA